MEKVGRRVRFRTLERQGCSIGKTMRMSSISGSSLVWTTLMPGAIQIRVWICTRRYREYTFFPSPSLYWLTRLLSLSVTCPSPVPSTPDGRPGSILSISSNRSIFLVLAIDVAQCLFLDVTKSGIMKDERDTPKRRVRHRDGKLLRGGIGLTTELGWSDRCETIRIALLFVFLN
jgi:hypothetical protein